MPVRDEGPAPEISEETLSRAFAQVHKDYPNHRIERTDEEHMTPDSDGFASYNGVRFLIYKAK